MPEKGIPFVPRNEILTFEEIERLTKILAGLGISKVRITGGEPFVRKDLLDIFKRIKLINGIEEIHLTTNGVLTSKYLQELYQIGISGINLSLDTLDKKRFILLTRRDEIEAVLNTFHLALKLTIPLKINMVVMDGINSDDIVTMAELADKFPVEVRFIEEMPFNGGNGQSKKLIWNEKQIYAKLAEAFPNIQKINDEPFSTSKNFSVPGFKRNLGIIAGFTRTFCGTCNRIRITAQGMLKICLYDNGVLNLKDLLRNGASDWEIEKEFLKCINHRPKDGFEAENRRLSHSFMSESMAKIGG
jgi:cyclic pyranopterin phosphate synthase